MDKDGNAKVNFSVNATSVINNNKGSIKEASTDPKAANAGKVTVSDADKGKLATVDTVAEAINSAATFVKVADSQEVIELQLLMIKGLQLNLAIRLLTLRVKT